MLLLCPISTTALSHPDCLGQVRITNNTLYIEIIRQAVSVSDIFLLVGQPHLIGGGSTVNFCVARDPPESPRLGDDTLSSFRLTFTLPREIPATIARSIKV